MKLILQIAAGVVLGLLVVGLFDLLVEKYEFERRCHLIEGFDFGQKTRMCQRFSWFSHN
jgi:hypothetical protein